MESLNLIKNDPWLAPYKEAIEGRYQYVIDKEKSLTNNGKQTLAEMASGYLYFGLHKTNKGWVFREWAPNATAIYLIGTFNDWKKDERYKNETSRIRCLGDCARRRAAPSRRPFQTAG